MKAGLQSMADTLVRLLLMLNPAFSMCAELLGHSNVTHHNLPDTLRAVYCTSCYNDTPACIITYSK